MAETFPPRNPLDLSFVRIDHDGRLRWFAPGLPHDPDADPRTRGRVFAMELTALLHNPDRSAVPPHLFALVANAILDQYPSLPAGLAEGFFAGIGEALEAELKGAPLGAYGAMGGCGRMGE